LFLIILSILVILWINIYKIDSLLIELYSEINSQFIIDSINILINKEPEIRNYETQNLYEISYFPSNKNVSNNVASKLKKETSDIKKMNNPNPDLLNNDRKKSVYTLSSFCASEPNLNQTQDNLLNHINNNLGKIRSNMELILITQNEKEQNIINNNRLYSFKFDRFYVKKFLIGVLLVISLSYFFFIQTLVHPISNAAMDNYLIHQGTIYSQSMVSNMMVGSFLMSLSNCSPILDSDNSDTFLNYHKNANLYSRNFSNFKVDYVSHSPQIEQHIVSYNSLDFCTFFFNKTSIINDYNYSRQNIKDCVDDLIRNGLNIYFSHLKMNLKNIYEEFKHNKNRTVDYLINIMESSTVQKAQIFVDFYLRNYREDLMKLIKNNYTNSITFSLVMIKVFTGIFIFHLIVYIYYLLFYYSKMIYFHFEKKRILITILPKEKNSMITEKINKLLFRHF
jgi:hypothetical protein